MEKKQIEQAAKSSYIGYYNINDVNGLVEQHPHDFSEHYEDGFKAGVEWALKNSEKQYSEDDLQDAWNASKSYSHFEDWLKSR